MAAKKAAKKAVMLVSGGIDSRVASAMLQAQGYELHAFTLDWRIGTPLEPAVETARLYCADHLILPYNAEAWEPINRADQPRPAHTPMLTHALGAAYAARIGATFVASGMRREGRRNDAEYLSGIGGFMGGATAFGELKYLAPLWDCTAAGVAALAERYSVPLADTYSCWASEPCGECVGCKRRKEVGLWQR